jgi:hypothetical protein
MNSQLINEILSKIESYDHKLDLLLQKGGNDEKIIAKRKELLNQYYNLKKQNEKK